jgi:hypothetical protein
LLVAFKISRWISENLGREPQPSDTPQARPGVDGRGSEILNAILENNLVPRNPSHGWRG